MIPVKKMIMALLAILLVLINTSFVTYPDHYFMAYVVQDGVVLPIDQHVVKVKKRPFEIVLDLPNKKGIFVHMSYDEKTFNGAIENENVSGLPGFDNTAVFELWNNPDLSVFMADHQPMYWFIDHKSKTRFSSYEIINDRYLCVRKVDNIYDLDAHQEVELSAMKQPVYFTFLKFEEKGDNYRFKEVMRHEFKIEWVD